MKSLTENLDSKFFEIRQDALNYENFDAATNAAINNQILAAKYMIEAQKKKTATYKPLDLAAGSRPKIGTEKQPEELSPVIIEAPSAKALEEKAKSKKMYLYVLILLVIIAISYKLIKK